jgi:hypothetical protein
VSAVGDEVSGRQRGYSQESARWDLEWPGGCVVVSERGRVRMGVWAAVAAGAGGGWSSNTGREKKIVR